MARRRNREVNIFNMSLLDILCGALGAFCFMMIALLPFYKPPGTAKDTRENQQKLAEKLKQLDDASKKVGDSPAVEDLRQLVNELKKQIQEMQGQLNQALSELEQVNKKNVELTALNASLVDENEKLKEMLRKMTSTDALAELQKRIDQVERQLAQTAEKLKNAEGAITGLLDKNEQLTKNNAHLEKKIQDRTPITIHVAYNPTQNVDFCIENATLNKDTVKFNPLTTRSLTMSPEDTYFIGRGYATYLVSESAPETDYRLYLNLVTPPGNRATNRTRVGIYYGSQADITPPAVDLTLERPWVLYGTLRLGKDRRLIFQPATEAERDAMWEKINQAASKNGPGGQATPSSQLKPNPGSPPPKPTWSSDPAGTPRQAPGQISPKPSPSGFSPPRNPALDLQPSNSPASP